MPLGGKALKRREQAADEKAGIIRDELTLRKMANAKLEVSCSQCGTIFKVTKKNVDARTHCDSKHPKNTFEECFPTIVADEKAEAAAGGGGGGGGGGAEDKKKAASKKKKQDDTMALLDAGLAGASISKKK